jgi:pimeloyl-ACP methyl ester carboxylesterase
MVQCTVARDGFAIHFHALGEGPETLILLNGSVFNHRQWNRTMLPQLRRRLGRRLRLVQLDYPGFGRSPRGPRPIESPLMTRLVVGLIDQLQVQQVHLFGFSMGSLIGRGLLFEHPHRVGSWAGYGNPCLEREEFLERLADCQALLDGLRRLQDLWDRPIDRENLPRVWREAFAPMVFDGLSYAQLSWRRRLKLRLARRFIAEMLIGTPLCSVVELFERYAALPASDVAYFREGLTRIPRRVPLLLLAGTADTVTPPAMNRELARRLPGATAVELAGLSHMGPMGLRGQARRLVGTYARWLGPLLER